MQGILSERATRASEALVGVLICPSQIEGRAHPQECRHHQESSLSKRSLVSLHQNRKTTLGLGTINNTRLHRSVSTSQCKPAVCSITTDSYTLGVQEQVHIPLLVLLCSTQVIYVQSASMPK